MSSHASTAQKFFHQSTTIIYITTVKNIIRIYLLSSRRARILRLRTASDTVPF
jgi:hypothetical protein